jgi:quercetin dioxygenase-like cupin family protein
MVWPAKEDAAMTSRMLIAMTAAVAIIAGEAAGKVSSAEDQPITRTELLRANLTGIEGKETVIYIADVKPGGVGGKHTHYGDEFVYILEGELIVEPVGKPPITLKVGNVGHLTPDVVHAARNGSGREAAKVLVILVVDKGKPLAEAVK